MQNYPACNELIIIKYQSYVFNYLKEVAVYGIHVAAAVGTIQAIENTVLQNDDDCDRIKGLFKLDPCLVAVLKNSKVALHPKIWDFIGGWEYLSNVELTFYMIVGNEGGYVENVEKAENVEKVKLRELSILIFLVEQRNIPLLKIYMDKQEFDRYFLEALNLACELRFDDAIDTLLNHRDWLATPVVFGDLSCGEPFKPFREEFPTIPRSYITSHAHLS